MPRSGILAGGNFIIDYVKMIDAWPDQDMLANIRPKPRATAAAPTTC